MSSIENDFPVDEPLKPERTDAPSQPAVTKTIVKETAIEQLRSLYREAGLVPEDIFILPKWGVPVVTKPGIERLTFFFGIKLDIQLIHIATDGLFAVVKCVATHVESSRTCSSFGSALYSGEKAGGAGTTRSLYVTEISQKRAEARAVLRLSQQLKGRVIPVIGEAEIDD